MPRRPRIETDLPDDVRRWLDRALADGNFSGYERLEDLLRERGYVISKSAIHRYGAKLERKLAAIKSATEAAKLLADATPDDQDARSEALTAMIQTELFDALVNLQEATDENVDNVKRTQVLSAAAKNIATLTRASVNLKKFQVEANARAAEAAIKAAEKAMESGGSKNGLSEEGKRSIREALGVM